jgi:putative transposase
MIQALWKQLLIQIVGFVTKEAGEIIDFLHAENKILRSKIDGAIKLTDYDRMLLIKHGLPIKDRLHEFISIVKPETILNRNRRMKKEKWTYDNTVKSPGRPRKGKETEEIIMKLALENGWGYGRIQGEMKKLGYHVSVSYVRDVLKRNGIPPSDNRKGISWKQFISSHMDVLWATDFFTEEVWTRIGLTTYYILFFIHLSRNKIIFCFSDGAGICKTNALRPWNQASPFCRLHT